VASDRMPNIRRVCIIMHSAIPDCGSFEVWFADGRPSQYSHEQALEEAKALARAERVRGE
jgi:hypothetical protein